MSTGIDPLAIATEVRLGRMTRENVATKGRRYLIEGRLQIRLVSQTQVRALCRGNGDTYTVGYDRGGWHCDCPAKGRCCHLEALQLVCVRPGDDHSPPGGWAA
jgi:uncharacterized Zn finger protein